MFDKLLNGVAISYGPSFPTATVADGALFFKTISTTNSPSGFYIYGTRPDTSTSMLGPQVGQGWFPADVGDLYLRISGGTLTGPLGLTGYLSVVSASQEQRIVLGNSASVNPIVFSAKDKVLNIGLGSTFTGNGGVLTSALGMDFSNQTTGLKWFGKTIWTSGNDGTNSGLDADKLDGLESSVQPSPSTIPVRDTDGNLFVSKLNISTGDVNQPIAYFITTTNDNFTKKNTIGNVREVIRLDSATDQIRKIWNIDITGTAGAASSVAWENIANKPSWLSDGTVSWNDISGKPSLIETFNFTTDTNSKNPSEMTSGFTKDIFSGLWFGEHVKDAPSNNTSFRDPNGDYVFPIDRSNYWAGFQTMFAGDLGAGVQLLANWDAENIDTNNDGLSWEDNRSFLMYRVNDDGGGSTVNGVGNQVVNAQLNNYSPWIKIWTNITLTKVSQLMNDANYATATDLSAYLNLNSTAQQTIVGDVVFNREIICKNGNTNTLTINSLTGEITTSSTITANSHIQTPNGDIYTTNGKVWSANGKVGVGNANNNGVAQLQHGYSANGHTYTGYLQLSNADETSTFVRVIGDVTNQAALYQVDPDGQYGNSTSKHHWFNATIKTTGNVIGYVSDESLKLNVKTIDNALAKVKHIQGVSYDWDADACYNIGFSPDFQTETGFIAQRVQEVIPEAVTESAFGNGILTVNYAKTTPVLAAAINELSDEIERLKREIAELKKA